LALTGKHIASVENEHVGVYAISLVDKPANKATFVNPCKSGLCSLSENNEIVGLILRPTQEITRLNEDGTKWVLSFDRSGIKQAHESFAKNLAIKNSNLDHSDKQQKGITFTESWLVENSDNDKSKDYGFKPIVGEWYVKAKIENAEVLQALRTDTVKGFSLEGDFFLTAEAEKNTQLTKLKDMNILKIFGISKEDTEKVELAEALETKLATIDEVKDALMQLAQKIAELEPKEPTPEEMEADKAAEDLAAKELAAEEDKKKVEDEKKDEEMSELTSQVTKMNEQFITLTEQISKIPVDMETFREKLIVSDEEKIKLADAKVEKMSINDIIKHNKKTN